MKTSTTYFSSKNALKTFLYENKIIDSTSLMIQVFTPYADKLYIEELLSIINSLLPRANLIGSTTDGEINHGVLSKDETVLSFTLFSQTVLTPYISNNFANFSQAGENMALNLIEDDTKVIISFIDGTQSDNQKFLHGISNINSHVQIATGMAGVKNTFANTFVFNKHYIYTNAVVAIALHSKQLQIDNQSNSYWQTFGEKLTLTKVTLNRVYTINGKTAYDAYAHYLSESIAKQLPAIGIEFPLIVQRNSKYFTCVAVAKEDDGSLIFSGNLQEGDLVSFSFPNNHQQRQSIKKNKHLTTNTRVGAIFMPNSSQKNTYSTGFFTYGTFYNSVLTDKNLALLVLQESDDLNITSNNTIKALSHFIQITSKELEVAKNKLKNQEQTINNISQIKSSLPTSKSSAKSQIHTLNGSNVLLTEDNRTNQKIIQGILKESGIKLDIANNGQEAVSAFKKKEYELILMDVQMPLMDGLEASQHIRAINKNIPIIALTASSRPRDIEDTKLAGMNEHLNKPINVEKLFATLLKYITKKTDSKNIITSKNTNKLPDFKTIDTDLGLKYLGGNKSLYIKILKDFVQRYKNVNLEFLSYKEYNRVVHTIQGLSANIGANALHNTTHKLYFHVEDSITAEFYTQLNLVVAEIQNVLKSEKAHKILGKENISKKEKDNLFKKLKTAITEERPKLCTPLIRKLSHYNFTNEDKIFFNSIKEHVNEFDFDEALNIISKVY